MNGICYLVDVIAARRASLILLCRISGGVIPPSRRSLAGNYTSALMQLAKLILIILLIVWVLILGILLAHVGYSPSSSEYVAGLVC